jgi:serine/threonine-protein kinase
MNPGTPDVKAVFSEALELPPGPAREAYLAGACGEDAALRRRVEDLISAHGRAPEVLGPSGPRAAVEPAQADEATKALDPHAKLLSPSGMASALTVPSEAATVDAAIPLPGGAVAVAHRDGANGLMHGARIRYFGDYEIRGELGRGGMGVVYEARQVSLNRPVALKMLRAGLLASDDDLRRFRNEAEAVALLDHPSIVPVHEVGEHDGQRYLSMKLVPGGSLLPLLPRYRDDPKTAARLAAELAEAVAHAHARGILHRDLKPANVLVDPEGHPHVTDFGLAKRVEADIELTQSGAILGTPAYMSPEQAEGRRGAITTATDVYGLGAVLYALLTGRAPFGGDSVVDTLDAVRHAVPEPPTRVNARVPRDLETICLKCLQKDPRRRYPTAQALADDLHAWLDSRPIAARRVGPAERAWLWCKRRPAVAALSAAVLLATVGGTVAVIAIQARANAELRAANQRVQQRYDLAVEAIKTFHTGVSEDFLLKQDQFKALRDRLLNSASDFYRKLGALLGKETDVTSRRALEQSNFELAELTGKVGRIEAALAAHQAALAAREALAAEIGAGAGIKADVGRSLTAVADLLYATGKSNEGIQTYRRAESLLAGVAASDLEARAALAACRTRMARPLLHSGKTTEALAACKLARAAQEELASVPRASNKSRREFAATLNELGIVLWQTNKPAEAEPEFRTALAIQKKLADENPTVIDIRNYLANIHLHLGNVLRMTGKLSEAEAEFHEAMAIYLELIDQYPAITRSHRNLALCRSDLGFLLATTGRPREAEAEHRAAIAILQRLTEENPANTDVRGLLANSHRGLSRLLALAGKPGGAEAECRTALAIDQKLAGDDPKKTFFRSLVAESRVSLGRVLFVTGKPGEAEAECRMALAIFQSLADENPGDAIVRDGVASSLVNLGDAVRSMGRPAEARSEYERAIALFEQPVLQNPAGAWHRYMLACSLRRRALILRALGDPAGAAADVQRALALYDGPAPRAIEFMFEAGCCHAMLAGLAGRAGSGISAAEGARESERAMEWLRRAVALGYRNAHELRMESALDLLRGRADFRPLMLDLAFPADPFAR